MRRQLVKIDLIIKEVIFIKGSFGFPVKTFAVETAMDAAQKLNDALVVYLTPDQAAPF